MQRRATLVTSKAARRARDELLPHCSGVILKRRDSISRQAMIERPASDAGFTSGVLSGGECFCGTSIAEIALFGSSIS